MTYSYTKNNFHWRHRSLFNCLAIVNQKENVILYYKFLLYYYSLNHSTTFNTRLKKMILTDLYNKTWDGIFIQKINFHKLLFNFMNFIEILQRNYILIKKVFFQKKKTVSSFPSFYLHKYAKKKYRHVMTYNLRGKINKIFINHFKLEFSSILYIAICKCGSYITKNFQMYWSIGHCTQIMISKIEIYRKLKYIHILKKKLQLNWSNCTFKCCEIIWFYPFTN